MLPVNAASLHRQKIRLAMGYDFALGLDFGSQHIVLSGRTLSRFSPLAFRILSK
jgi:hypothetical protein